MQTLHRSYRHWLFVLIFFFMLTLAGMNMLSSGVLANANLDELSNTIYLPVILKQPPAGTVPGL